MPVSSTLSLSMLSPSILNPDILSPGTLSPVTLNPVMLGWRLRLPPGGNICDVTDRFPVRTSMSSRTTYVTRLPT